MAAHTDNYEVIKILLDRGAVLPMPHDVRQGFSSQRLTSVGNLLKADLPRRQRPSRLNLFTLVF
ncbi:MAG: hypothetical protein ACK559_10075, partial [bacterium]